MSHSKCFFFRYGNAFISSNKIYLEIEKKQDTFLKFLLNLLKNHQVHSAMLIGNNIALVVYGFYGVLLMNQIDSLGYHFLTY
jgi:hypothetical protein